MIDKVIGIDPGKQGGISVYENNTYRAYKMPDGEKEISALIKSIVQGSEYAVICYLEKVHSMPKQGVKSTWTFSGNYHTLRGILVTLNVPIIDVPPQRWMKELNCMTKGNKNVTKNKAAAIFESIKVTHALADALLICSYGVRLERRKGSLQ